MSARLDLDRVADGGRSRQRRHGDRNRRRRAHHGFAWTRWAFTSSGETSRPELPQVL